MIVAVIFEASGATRDAFSARGHHAVSVDLREALTPPQPGSEHIVGDAFEFMRSRFFREKVGLAILHYTCTFLAGSGIHWNARVPGRAEKTEAAIADVELIFELLRGKRYCFENPVGVISTRTKGRGGSARKPVRGATQYIQPYMFGDDASKNTGLWIDGLMPLVIPPRELWHPGRWVEFPVGSGKLVQRWSNQTDSGQNKLPPSDDRWAQRSDTFPGIANAFALNWG